MTAHGAPDVPERELDLGGLGARWAAAAAAIGVLGWAATAILAFAGEHGGPRFLRSYLVAFTFFLSLALGGLFFVLITHLTRAGWSVVLRRVAEALSLTMVPLAPLVLVLVFGRHELYAWTLPDVVAGDELLQHKSPYLNTQFFLVRVVFYFVIWIAMALYFGVRSLQQDRSGNPELSVEMERVAAPGAIFYAMTLTFASFDFLMSLYPYWYSTIFGVYWFSGGVLAAFSTVTLVVRALQRVRRLETAVTVEHYHDLGKLMFAFVVFWAYIAFSQYMLIWYAHIPEEAAWIQLRQEGPWGALSLLLLFGHFVIPFLWLMSRHVKRRRGVLVAAAVWLLAMHWLDLYWLVMPEWSPTDSPFHWLDLTCMLAVGGTVLPISFLALDRVRLLPVRDPRLAESLRLENV
jgi:hypothetical protein